MKKRKNTNIKKSHIVAALVSLVIFFSLVINSFRHSLFFVSRDRVNILFYGQNTVYYSIGKEDNINYSIHYYPDLKIPVPGGYGYYRIGALGKLVELEHKPEIFKKTFSALTASFVDIYFYESSLDRVYYGGKDSMVADKRVGFNDIFLSKSSAGLFDRVYIYLLLSQKRQEQASVIDTLPMYGRGDDIVFSVDDFAKRYIGFFYRKTYRAEKKNVQLLYGGSYKSALRLSDLLEGNGIRVSDLTFQQKNSKRCEIIDSKDTINSVSTTALDIASFFHCTIRKGDTGIYDIIFVLGNVEGEWEIL